MNRAAIVAVALAVSFAPTPYARYGVPRRAITTVQVCGSRDRHLHGKARVRARRG